MKIGIVLPQHDVGPSEVLEAARSAEAAGLDSVWLIDHLHGRPNPRRPILELGAMLPAVAQATSRVMVGPLILRVGLRLPAVAAAMVRTTSMIAAGRLIVALGLSDTNNSAEQSAYGLPVLPRSQRAEMMREAVAALRVEAPDVPVWIGGAGDDILEIARSVEGWNFWGKPDGMRDPLNRLLSAGYRGEISLAGSMPKNDEWGGLASMPIDHVIVATGRDNYRQRIDQLAALM